MTKLLSFLSWMSVLALWACAACIYINPALYGKYFAVLGLCFPLCATAVVGMGVICILFKPKMVWISVVGLLCAAGSVRDYVPINLTSPPPKQAWKVMTYNTMNYGAWKKDDNNRDFQVVRYIASQSPDIACLQETLYATEDNRQCVESSMKRYGYHLEQVKVGTGALALASRFPIVRTQRICHSAGNGAAAFFVVPQRGDTVIVICVHLESMHLSDGERSTYHELVRNPEKADNVHGKLSIVRKIANGGIERALQADTVAHFIDSLAGKPLILMGDFNDTPISYAHHQICSRLTDAYRATGNGIGRSFNRDAIYVRIDHAFCSSHFKPFAFKIDNTVPFSDHYPMIGYIKWVRNNPLSHR